MGLKALFPSTTIVYCDKDR